MVKDIDWKTYEQDTQKRFVNAYRDLGETNAQIDPWAHDQLDKHLAEIVQAIKYGIDLGEYLAVHQLGDSLTVSQFLDMRGYHQLGLRVLPHAVLASQKLGYKRDEAYFMSQIAMIYASVEQVEDAIYQYELALAIAREIEDRSLESTCLSGLGMLYNYLGQTEEAIDTINKGLIIAKEQGDIEAVEYRLSALGTVYASIGQVEEAIAIHEQCLASFREFGHKRTECDTLRELAEEYLMLKQDQKAINYLKQALKLNDEIRDISNRPELLRGLGEAYFQMGWADRAINYYEEGLTLARKMGMHTLEASILAKLAKMHERGGSIEKAKDYNEDVLYLARITEDRRLEEIALSNVAWIYICTGSHLKLLESLEQLALISEQIGSPDITEKRRKGIKIAKSRWLFAIIRSLVLILLFISRILSRSTNFIYPLIYESQDKYDIATEAFNRGWLRKLVKEMREWS